MHFMRDTQHAVNHPTRTLLNMHARLRVEDLVSHNLGPVSLSLDAGECVCLSGPSGAGKTLLLRAMADLDPHTGQVLLDGVECQRLRAHEWRRRVAMLPAESHWWHPTVGEHFLHADAALVESLGFERGVMAWQVSRMSSGERQRLALLRMLTHQPRVLLLDEVSANLDAENVRRVETLIAAYRAEHNAAVLWVSHDMEQIARISTRHCMLADGKLVNP